jgi:hypothetical protein
MTSSEFGRPDVFVDVDVLEEISSEGMPAITDEPELIQVVDVAMPMHLVGHVGDETASFTDRRLALGAIGQLALQVVEVVVRDLKRA